ncbi:MAG: tail fiber protein [Paludibacter sp.]|nr:tail fiber protein [Bacteroidales bacterium]MCM1069815.1 tail fiber protein [Prevotella sp.]MCM1353991.1 tail fiber protein [Bacteroides sp.]MCM1443367.1 tail fiber protein [Muribaculum sp.]MCM1482070.1 tail fiber protein [Paludibacter sp.]
MNTQQFKNNGHSKFPLSTDTLQFMQEQICFLQQLTAAIGQDVIIQQPTATANGLCIIQGELLPLQGKPDDDSNIEYIAIVSTSEDITALGETYHNARTRRYATYTGTKQDNAKEVYSFYDFQNKPLTEVRKYIDHLRQHAVPKGTIVMWSGTIRNIPAGWLLCDGQAGTPDLRGRFIVGYDEDSNYYNTIGNTGGAERVKLTAYESGLPIHSHGISEEGAHSHNVTLRKGSNGTPVLHKGYTGASEENAGTLTTTTNGAHKHNIDLTGGSAALSSHENRPPYYTLAFIIKTTDIPTL